MKPEIEINKQTQKLTAKLPEISVTIDIVMDKPEETAKQAINMMLNRIVQDNDSEFVLKSDIKNMNLRIKYLEHEKQELEEKLRKIIQGEFE